MLHLFVTFCFVFVFFFKQKTAYEMRISDWSSDVCSSDLVGLVDVLRVAGQSHPAERTDAAAEQRQDIGRHEAREVESLGDADFLGHLADEIGRASCRERVCQYV